MALKKGVQMLVLVALVWLCAVGPIVSLPAYALADTVESTSTSPATDASERSERALSGLVDTRVLGNAYVNVYIAKNGINRNVTLVIVSNSLRAVDVRMIGHDGSVIWEEAGAIPTRSPRQRTFWCGSDVRAIQARLSGSDIHPDKANCEVWLD